VAHRNEEKLAYFQANGATSNDYNTAQDQFLRAQPGVTGGPVADMWYQYLRAEGYAGSNTDMLDAFWRAHNVGTRQVTHRGETVTHLGEEVIYGA
jgi:hypothetical protein